MCPMCSCCVLWLFSWCSCCPTSLCVCFFRTVCLYAQHPRQTVERTQGWHPHRHTLSVTANRLCTFANVAHLVQCHLWFVCRTSPVHAALPNSLDAGSVWRHAVLRGPKHTQLLLRARRCAPFAPRPRLPQHTPGHHHLPTLCTRRNPTDCCRTGRYRKLHLRIVTELLSELTRAGVIMAISDDGKTRASNTFRPPIFTASRWCHCSKRSTA